MFHIDHPRKHFGFNEQETHRGYVNSVVDDSTASLGTSALWGCPKGRGWLTLAVEVCKSKEGRLMLMDFEEY